MSESDVASNAESGGLGSRIDPVIQLCAFYIGAQEYVIDLMRVEEILHAPPLTPVPSSPSFVEGVMNLRGVIVPVIDLRKWLGSTSSTAVKPKCLICRIGQRRLAVLVDALSDVLRLRKSQIGPVPSMVAPGSNPAIIGVCGPPDKLKLLLNLKALPRSQV
jgi:purine-binding chemotaxis protein CheW